MNMSERENAAVDAVEEMCTPERLSKEDAVDFLQGVIARLQSSIEALQEEIENQ